MTARRFAPLFAVAFLVLFTTCNDAPTTVELEGVQVPSVVRSDVQHAAPLHSSGDLTLETITTLYDQWTGIPTGGASALGGCGGAGCYIADDFIVPAGETWYVSQVRANGERRGTLPFRIRFYADNSDKPGALVFDADNLTDFVESPRGPTRSDFDINLGQAATLAGGGKYWLAIRTGTATTFEFLWGGTGPPEIPEIGTPSQESNGGSVWESSRGLTIRSFALFGNTTLPVLIDIAPVNCNKPTSNISVSILSTASFDATTVDHTTVTFEGASEVHAHPKTGEPRRHENDVDGDGDIDLLFHFRFGDTALTCESTEGTIEGETFGGMQFFGTGTLTAQGGGGGPGGGGGGNSFALSFDGSDGTETPGADDLDLTDTWTVEGWIKPSQPEAGTQCMICKWGLSVSASYAIAFENDGRFTNGRFDLVTHDPTAPDRINPNTGLPLPNNTKIFSSQPFQADVWQHFAVVFDQGQVWLYINGVLDTSCGGALGNCYNGNVQETIPSVPYMNTPEVTTSRVTLGRQKSPENWVGNYYFGLMDELRFWKVARTQAEIADNMNSQISPKTKGLVAYWRMDEGSGQFAFDATHKRRGSSMQLGDVDTPDVADPTWVSPGKP
jgi:hypothetical protein